MTEALSTLSSNHEDLLPGFNGYHNTIANFKCQLVLYKGYPDSGKALFLGVPVRAYPEETGF